MENIKINGHDLYKEYGLVIGNNDIIGIPKPKSLFIEVPGLSRVLDLSESLTGGMEYENRILKFKLGGSKPIENWYSFLSAFLMDVHGKAVKIIFDKDPYFYYEGRAEVLGFDRVGHLGYIELEVNCSPYKYVSQPSNKDWEWDDFNFELGIIREYKDLIVDGKKELDIIGSDILVIPIFHISNTNPTNEMSVTSKRLKKTFELFEGINRISELEIIEDGDKLIFNGEFTLSIDFKGGRL